MANLGDISKINLPNGNVVNIKDATARAQALIAANQSTQYNYSSVLSMSGTSGFTSTYYFDRPIPTGIYRLVCTNVRTDTSKQCQFQVVGTNASVQYSNLAPTISTANYVSYEFTTTFDLYGIKIYCNTPIEITNLAIIPKTLYDAGFTSYQPYALPNTKITPELIELVDSGAKNLLNNTLISGTVSSQITATVSTDKQVTLSGTTPSNADASFTTSTNTQFPAGTYIGSGSPSGGAIDKYRIDYVVNDSAVYRDTGNGVEFTLNSASNVRSQIVVYRGNTAPSATFKPMVCSKAAWDVSQKYVPYVPSNAELTKFTPVTKSKRHIPQSADYEIVSDLTISIPGGKKYLIHAMAMFSNVAPKGVIINKTNTIAANKNTVYAEITNDANDFGGLTTSAIMSNTGSTAFDVCIFAKFKSANASGSDVIVTYQDIT